MIKVTETAQKQVKSYFNDKKPQPVRIFVSSGCGGSQLAMAIDKIKKTDSVFTYDGVDYIMETNLLEHARPVEIDFSETGFKLNSSLELGGVSCGSCSRGSSCCG